MYIVEISLVQLHGITALSTQRYVCETEEDAEKFAHAFAIGVMQAQNAWLTHLQNPNVRVETSYRHTPGPVEVFATPRADPPSN